MGSVPLQCGPGECTPVLGPCDDYYMQSADVINNVINNVIDYIIFKKNGFINNDSIFLHHLKCLLFFGQSNF